MTNDVEVFAKGAYDALTSGASPLVSMAAGWAALSKASGAYPIYAYRPLLNAEEVIEHYRAQGVAVVDDPDEYHVTVVYSRRSFFTVDDAEWAWMYDYKITAAGGNRFTRKFGPDDKALVLVFDSPQIVAEWNSFRMMGASWDYESFSPHVSISYQSDADPNTITPFTGDLLFGGLQFREIRSGMPDLVEKKNGDLPQVSGHAIIPTIMQKQMTPVQIVKMDDEQRVVWGWVSVATENGEDVYDVHDDHIPMAELEKASVDFMLKSRVGKSMHEGAQVSDVVGCLPLSAELAKSLGISCEREGLIMGFRVNDEEVWKSVKSGELSAFSIGGRGVRVEA